MKKIRLGNSRPSLDPGTKPLFRTRRNVTSPVWHLGHVTALARQTHRRSFGADTGLAGPIARLWATALAGLVDIGVTIEAPGDKTVRIRLPKTATKPEVELPGTFRSWSNAIERDRARTYLQAYAAAALIISLTRQSQKCTLDPHGHVHTFSSAGRAIGCGFHEAVRGVLRITWGFAAARSRIITRILLLRGTLVIREIFMGRPGLTNMLCKTRRSSKTMGRTSSKGIDIMRVVRSSIPARRVASRCRRARQRLKKMHVPTALAGSARLIDG